MTTPGKPLSGYRNIEQNTPAHGEKVSTIDPLLIYLGKETADLRAFRDGQGTTRKRKGFDFSGFLGRPQLIDEIAPILELSWAGHTRQSIKTNISSLRTWWRIIDEVEKEAGQTCSVNSAMDITEVHWAKAVQRRVTRSCFYLIREVVEIVRRANGKPPVFWNLPKTADTERQLLAERDLLRMRNAIRREWYATLDNWEKTDALMAQDHECNPEDHCDHANITQFMAAISRTGKANPAAADIRESTKKKFNRQGFSVRRMRSALYPDEKSIRAIFFQCLSGTGWNPSTLLNLKVSESFLEDHMADPQRYLLTGYKPRAHSHQYSIGLWKSQSSAGYILLKLLQRTEPLREQLRNELSSLETSHCRRDDYAPSTSVSARQRIDDLKAKIDCPFLYVPVQGNTEEICCLTAVNYAGKFLPDLVSELNRQTPELPPIAVPLPSDLRDGFATFVWRHSRGSILHMMLALGHKSIRSTRSYINNGILNRESKETFAKFINLTWSRIISDRTVDPTLLAAELQFEEFKPVHVARLQEYRELALSRLGVGCKFPYSPPKNVEPRYDPKAGYPCGSQRCMHCPENAVILADSCGGLAMRAEELLHVQASTSLQSWTASQYDIELENVETALRLFDPSYVNSLRLHWRSKIENGLHRVPFN